MSRGRGGGSRRRMAGSGGDQGGSSPGNREEEGRPEMEILGAFAEPSFFIT